MVKNHHGESPVIEVPTNELLPVIVLSDEVEVVLINAGGVGGTYVESELAVITLSTSTVSKTRLGFVYFLRLFI